MHSQVVVQPYGRAVGDYVLLEQAGAWTASSLPICVCACMHGHRAWDARIKKRLVEIKALPQSLLARLQATRMTNPSLHTLQCPLWSWATEARAAA